jgi:hypothetical protein
MWLTKAYPAWADPVMALLFTVAAVWLALRGVADPGAADGVPAPNNADIAADRPRPDPSNDGLTVTRPDTGFVVLASLLVTAPLAIRRRWPTAMFVTQFAGTPGLGGAGTRVSLGRCSSARTP